MRGRHLGFVFPPTLTPHYSLDLVAIDPNPIGPIASHPFAVPCGIASTYHFRCRSSVGLSCRCVAWKLQMLESGVEQLPRKEPPAHFEPWIFIRRESIVGKLRQTLIRFGLSHGFLQKCHLIFSLLRTSLACDSTFTCNQHNDEGLVGQADISIHMAIIIGRRRA
jgi:hypothetical protein